jgi:hypothetical protein
VSNKSNRNSRKSASTAAKGAAAPKATAPAPVVTPPVAAAAVTTKPVQVVPGLKIEKDRPEQNGIKRPSEGGRCRAVWDACDEFAQRTGFDPTAKEVREMATANGWNANNASIEFYQWRKFNGITGRSPKRVDAQVDAAETDAAK